MTESIFLGVTSAALCVNLGWGLRRCGGGGENGSSLLGAASSGTHFMSFTCLEGRYRLRMEQMRNPRLGEGVSLMPGPSAGGVAGGVGAGITPHRLPRGAWSLCFIQAASPHTVRYIFPATLGGVFNQGTTNTHYARTAESASWANYLQFILQSPKCDQYAPADILCRACLID